MDSRRLEEFIEYFENVDERLYDQRLITHGDGTAACLSSHIFAYVSFRSPDYPIIMHVEEEGEGLVFATERDMSQDQIGMILDTAEGYLDISNAQSRALFDRVIYMGVGQGGYRNPTKSDAIIVLKHLLKYRVVDWEPYTRNKREKGE